MGRATLPPFLLQRDKWRVKDKACGRPNTEKKAAIWPASGVSGEQASSLADGSLQGSRPLL